MSSSLVIGVTLGKNSLAIWVTLALCLVGVSGDYLLKRASLREPPLQNFWFAVGFIVYSSTAFGWVYVMRHLKFATIGVIYAMSTVILLTIVGTLILGEPLRKAEALGLVLALAAIGLLARFA